ncbi:interleukin-10 receptor subunit beta-like isoform X2 [Cinclus cinclus]|uniref:interleukin-10 receptor subunit beta-like isoform X2 n=1 Tax=Cinclus cinclus TaxID=127875 RepID=UPI002E13BA8F
MAAARCGGLLLCCGLLLCVSGMIPEPQNARITSVNLHSTLQWDAPRFPKGNITYTVQYKSTYVREDTYETLRTGLRLPRCDLSSLSAYGDYILQLRAEAGPLRSPWLSLRFKPMDNTTIGPPEVRLKSESGALHVDCSGPFAERRQDRWPLKQYYGSWKYRILYWREGSTDKVAQVETQHSSEILSQLQPWTVYCVRVQAVIPELNKTGELSRELCEQTTHNGVTPVWIIVTVLVGSMLVVVTAVTVCFFCTFYLYRLTKHVFCPSYVFPQHLKEPFPPLPQEEPLLYDRLTVISQESQSLSEGSGNEASRTPEQPEDSAQGDSDPGVGAASGRA